MKRVLPAITFLLLSISAFSQQIPYSNCESCWLPDSLGNHRVVVTVGASGKFARVLIPWRRRDTAPRLKRIIIVDAKTQQKVTNIKTGELDRESGELTFEPVSGPGTYYVYYLAYKNEGRSNYPRGVYLKPEQTATAAWLGQLAATSTIPAATVTGFQSIDAFNSFYPMEVIATAAETNALIQKHSTEKFLVFPEDRLNSIRMTDDLPQSWIERGPQNMLTAKTLRGENFSFQLGIYALKNLTAVKVTFSALSSGSGKTIGAERLFCINTSGTGYDGHTFNKVVAVDKGKIQALWCGISIPESAVAGTYQGEATITESGMPEKKIRISLEVLPGLAENGGVDIPQNMTRLGWLNSTMAQKNTVIAPYTPLVVKGHTISLLGRKIELGQNGFPRQIQTFFTREMTAYAARPADLLAAPLQFRFIKANDGKDLILKSQKLQFTKVEAGTVQWKVISANDQLQLEVSASLEFDGFVAYKVKLTALKDLDLKDISMSIPFHKDVATYMMGLGQKGGYRPDDFDWKWDVTHKNQDGAWIGTVNAGLQYSLRDEKYVRPLNTNFYLQKPLVLPSSWGNGSSGGISIKEDQHAVIADNYSGERKLQKGEVLWYNFNLLVTPFHTLNTDFQWSTRFYHAYKPIDTIQAAGATLINIHHATAINPYINYPFIAWKKLKAYDDSAHAAGLKVKIYNTIRELSDHAWETFALRSLGHEIYSPGKGGGFSWLQEHLGNDYIAAWFVPEIKDAAIINSGMNRWHNYYVEGMNWLTQHAGIDGIYLDDVAFDRITMKRVKRVLTRDGHPGIIDLHSANQYNKSDGFNNSANLYMEHFPYLNRLWFGEYFNYEKNKPDFFLTEVSGIPFGLMGEMLEGGGNPWRGMVYGMTNRIPWSDNADPRPIWKVWDAFGMKGSRMIGYWVTNSPVKTGSSTVLATVYQKPGTALVSIASWAGADTSIQLQIDWKKLGIDPAKATLTAPEMKNFQPGRVFQPGDRIPVLTGKGWLLILK